MGQYLMLQLAKPVSGHHGSYSSHRKKGVSPLSSELNKRQHGDAMFVGHSLYSAEGIVYHSCHQDGGVPKSPFYNRQRCRR
jgi:hypothetical protein